MSWRPPGCAATRGPGRLLQSLRGLLLHQAAEQGLRRTVYRELRRSLQSRPAHPEPCDVLWLSVGASSADLTAQLQEPLERVHNLRSAVLDFHYFGSAEALARRGLPFDDIGAFTRPEDWRRAAPRGGEAARWSREARERLGTSPLAQELPPRQFSAIVQRLDLVLRRDALPWLVQGAAAQRALETYRPRVVVSSHVYGPPLAPLVIAAHRAGTTTRMPAATG